MPRWQVFVVVIAALVCAACGQSKRPHPASPAGRLSYAHLPRLRGAAHRELQAELSLVEQAGGTPLQLDPTAAEEVPSDEAQLAPARLLIRAFPPLSRALVQGQLDEIYRGGPLALSPVQLERGRELLHKYAHSVQEFHAALPAEGQGFGIRQTDGVLADMEFLDPLVIGCRMEAAAAALSLADNRPDDALPHLEVMFRAARLLAAEPNVTLRIAAVNVRADALEVLRAIAAHHDASRATHEQLFTLLTRQTADWPDDSRAWVGDRAAGLLVYELVRDGQYLSLLTKEEVQALEAQHIVRVTAKAVMRHIDGDELFYLRAMRRIIDVSQSPYFQRAVELQKIRGELAALEATADYPLVAGNMLLADFETGQRRQAEDFVRCQAWTLALGTALDRETFALPTNPLTGRPYHIERTPLAVTVAGVLDGQDEPCLVPLLPARRTGGLSSPTPTR